MPIPVDPAPFAPQEVKRLFAADEALFLVDPLRLQELSRNNSAWFERLVGPQAVGRATSPACSTGALVPALGLERGSYTVLVRSTETEGSVVPLTHVVFSTGFVLGTETGSLSVSTLDNLKQGTAGRTVQISPGWYGVTVVAGLRAHEDDDEREQEEWIVCFLLEPQPEQPGFTADMGKMLGIFG